MLFLTEKRINIGINEHAGEAQRHGVLCAVVKKDGKETEVRIPVIIDKPHLVCDGLNYATWRRVKTQLRKMGITASHIELKFDEKKFERAGHYCYTLDEYKEIYNLSSKGKPVYTEGFA